MRFTTIFAAIMVIGLAYWAYHQTIQTQMADRQVERLQREIGAAHERLSVLRAEWAYLNRPDRLRDLADFNFERLGLMPMAPSQFGEVALLPYPPLRDPLAASEAVQAGASTGQGSGTEANP